MITEEKLMFAPAGAKCTLSIVTVFVREAFPTIPIVPPLVLMVPPMLIAVKLALVLVAEKLASAVVTPTEPERVIVPLEPAINVRA